MNEERKRVCDKCKHPTSGLCEQRICPINQEEYEYMGAKPSDRVTASTLLKLMEISMKPECMKRILEIEPIEHWVRLLGGDD
jgi:hypothetical protein